MSYQRFAFFSITVFISLAACRNQESTVTLLGQNNAIWTESIYLRGFNPSTNERLTIEKVKKYAYTLKEHHIKYAYLFAGPYGKDGHLPSYAFSQTAIHTVALLKNEYPELIILPWVGGVQNRTVYLGDSSWIKNALQDTKKLINVLNVPGVHVDWEYILAGDAFLDKTIEKEKPGDRESYAKNVNEFHRKLRLLLPQAFISSVVVSTSPDTEPWKRKTSVNELSTLVNFIDQLSFLYYDTHLSDQQLFEENCLSLIRDIQTLKSKRDIQYLIAIGTFVNVPELRKYRDLLIESIPNTLLTIQEKAQFVSPRQQLVNGIAIFCDWETDEDEWKQFDKYWAKAGL